MPYTVILLLLLITVKISSNQESAQYLRNVIRELKEMKDKSTDRRIQNTERTLAESTLPPETYINRRIQNNNNVPQLSLTKGELASLYQKAVSKGHTIQLDTGDDTYVNAAIHELDDSDDNHHSPPDESLHADESSYYYYYYPIKSFLDGITSQSSDNFHLFSHSQKPTPQQVLHAEPKRNYNYHKHTHQHNVNISKTTPEESPNKLEPLFMAISGFLGMAVMYVLSILFLPRLAKTPKPKGKQDLGEIARIALQAIEGQDCRERFACELSKTARSLNLHENRFVKLFWRVAPTSISKQFARVNKYSNKQMKCTAIPCKKKQAVAKSNVKTKKKTKKS